MRRTVRSLATLALAVGVMIPAVSPALAQGWHHGAGSHGDRGWHGGWHHEDHHGPGIAAPLVGGALLALGLGALFAAPPPAYYPPPPTYYAPPAYPYGQAPGYYYGYPG